MYHQKEKFDVKLRLIYFVPDKKQSTLLNKKIKLNKIPDDSLLCTQDQI